MTFVRITLPTFLCAGIALVSTLEASSAIGSDQHSPTGDQPAFWTVAVRPGVPAAGAELEFRFDERGDLTDAPIAAGLVSDQRETENSVSSVAASADAARVEKSRAKTPSPKNISRKTPMARETASRKAREEWQRQQSSASGGRKVAPAEDSGSTQRGQRAGKPLGQSSGKDRDPERMPELKSPEVRQVGRPAAERQASVSGAVAAESRSYWQIYRSIPFSRAEYDANPSYRHQATMEILLGQLHPVIVSPVVPVPGCGHSGRPVTVRILPLNRSRY